MYFLDLGHRYYWQNKNWQAILIACYLLKNSFDVLSPWTKNWDKKLWYECLVIWRKYYIIYIYRVSQEECTKLRESVPYVKLYRYNPKHPCPKLNGYGDNGQRKVWSSGRSTHWTCHCTSLIEAPFLCMVSNYGNSAHDNPELHMTSLQLDKAVHFAAGLWEVRRLVVRSCYNAFCVFPRGILWHALHLLTVTSGAIWRR